MKGSWGQTLLKLNVELRKVVYGGPGIQSILVTLLTIKGRMDRVLESIHLRRSVDAKCNV